MKLTGLVTSYTKNDFHHALQNAKRFVILTGAGVSSESGIPTFRDVGGLWRNIEIRRFATPNVFRNDPASVWEFYHYRREFARDKKPNKAHIAIAECEKWFEERGDNFTLITQNVDGLHQKAGSKNVLEIHGSLFKTRCTKCGKIEENFDSPICEALRGKEALFDQNFTRSDIPVKELPHCKECKGLLRPHVAWYFEPLPKGPADKVWEVLDRTDLFMIIGTSSKVFPAASYGSYVVKQNKPVAEFNIKKGPYTDSYRYYYKGPATETVPEALDRNWRLSKSDS